MEYTKYKDFNISKIGLGCYSLADLNGKINITNFKEKVNNSLKLGVNFFDTTTTHNGSEYFLGEILKPYRYDVYISSKVNIDNSIIPGNSIDYLRTYCESTLAKLKTDYIDIYNLNINSLQISMDEIIYALDQLIKEGKIRKYGISNLPRKNPDKYVEKRSVFSMIMKLYSLPYNSLNKTLNLCKANKIRAIISTDGSISSHLNKNRSCQTHTQVSPNILKDDYYNLSLKIQEKFNSIAKLYNTTSTQVAISWTLSHPEIICVLLNLLAQEPLKENIEGSSLDLCKEHIEEINDLWK